MDETSIYGLPFPEDTDAPDGPTQIEALAERLETVLGLGLRVYEPTIIAGENTRTENTYATLSVADEITGLVVPKGGLVIVDYSAIVECEKAQKARAAIFLGNNQLKISTDGAVSGGTQAAVFGGGGSNVGERLTTFPGGLICNAGNAGTYTPHSDPTTGLAGAVFLNEGVANIEVEGAVTTILNAGTLDGVLGGLLVVRALAENTYTLSVRFKTSEGTLKAKERRLWAAVAGKGV